MTSEAKKTPTEIARGHADKAHAKAVKLQERLRKAEVKVEKTTAAGEKAADELNTLNAAYRDAVEESNYREQHPLLIGEPVEAPEHPLSPNSLGRGGPQKEAFLGSPPKAEPSTQPQEDVLPFNVTGSDARF